MKKISFKEYLLEAPLNDYEVIGDWNKGSSFRDPRDRRLIQNPRSIEIVRKKFGNTSYNFNFYFVNSAKADKHTEVGLVSPKWVQENLGDEVFMKLQKNIDNDSINVIFTNNKGAERMPMTAWMMAHRIGHALARENGRAEAHNQYHQTENHLVSQFSDIMSSYSRNFQSENGRQILLNRKDQLTMIHFFQNVCTFKSARDHNLRNWFEVLNELIAQYLTTGVVKFSKAPQSFGGKDKYYVKKEELADVNERLETLGRDMQFLIDDILTSVVNSVLVM